MREYNDYIRVMLRDGDRERINGRMREAGIRNMSAYIRKMAIDGCVIMLDLSDLKEITRLLRICSNNLNQYAKRANETGSIYAEDIKDIEKRVDETWNLLKEMYRRLTDMG